MEEWDVVILINQSDWPVSPARPYTKVIIKLKVLDTLGLVLIRQGHAWLNSQLKAWEVKSSKHAMC